MNHIISRPTSHLLIILKAQEEAKKEAAEEAARSASSSMGGMPGMPGMGGGAGGNPMAVSLKTTSDQSMQSHLKVQV